MIKKAQQAGFKIRFNGIASGNSGQEKEVNHTAILCSRQADQTGGASHLFNIILL
jgi:hypothetical protein